MHLGIYSIQETLFSGEVEKIIAQTPMGEITVLDGHIPLISKIKGERVIIEQKGKSSEISIQEGILEVRPENEVVILASS